MAPSQSSRIRFNRASPRSASSNVGVGRERRFPGRFGLGSAILRFERFGEQLFRARGLRRAFDQRVETSRRELAGDEAEIVECVDVAWPGAQRLFELQVGRVELVAVEMHAREQHTCTGIGRMLPDVGGGEIERSSRVAGRERARGLRKAGVGGGRFRRAVGWRSLSRCMWPGGAGGDEYDQRQRREPCGRPARRDARADEPEHGIEGEAITVVFWRARPQRAAGWRQRRGA